MFEINKITIYCDGACRGNQNKKNISAYGAVLNYETDGKGYVKAIKQAEANTTNNIQELKAAINSLKQLKRFDIPVEVITDSNYVVQGINNWIHNWIKKGWRNSQKKPVENKELWQELYGLKNKFKDIKFTHCSGHYGIPGNEQADELCNQAMDEFERRKSE